MTRQGSFFPGEDRLEDKEHGDAHQEEQPRVSRHGPPPRVSGFTGTIAFILSRDRPGTALLATLRPSHRRWPASEPPPPATGR